MDSATNISRTRHGADIFYFYLAHSRLDYHLGMLYEEMGEVEKAIDHYERQLTRWKDADDDMPQLQDTRRRLTMLRPAA